MVKKLSFIYALALFGIMSIIGFYVDNNKKKHDVEMQRLYDEKTSFVFDVLIPTRAKEANILSNNIKSKIIEVFNKDYPNKDVLKKELQGVLDKEVSNSLAVKLVGDLIKGVTLNNVAGDSISRNDLIITIKNPKNGEYIIFIDLSPDCAKNGGLRTRVIERKEQFSKKLFDKAFHDFTVEGRNLTFWHYIPLDEEKWRYEVENMESTDFKILRKMYEKYNVDNDFLSKFEFLVSNRIYDDEDYFGNSEIYNGVFINKNMTIIVTSGFNIIDQLKEADLKELQLYDEKIKSEETNYSILEAVSMAFSFIIVVIMGGLFVHSLDYKK